MAHRTFSRVLIGDELGFVKRLDIECESNSSHALTTLNREFIGDPSPDKSVLSIYPLAPVSMLDSDGESGDDSGDDSDDDSDDVDKDRMICTSSEQSGKTKSTASKRFNTFEESKFMYLIASRPNHIYLYNSYNEQFTSISSSNDNGNGDSGKLLGAVPINGNSFVSCYDNGRIIVQSIKSDILTISSQCNQKALKILGIEQADRTSSLTSPAKRLKKSHGNFKPSQSDSKQKNKNSSYLHTEPSSSMTTIFSPNWHTSNTCVTCFKVSDNRIAIAGKNVDLRVFDLTTKQCIFHGKSQTKDFLGIRNKIWVSGVEWLGPLAGKQAIINKSTLLSAPSMIATCSRTEPVVRIYDLKSKQRKPIWVLNLKDQTFNNDSNPPAFTTMTATSTPGLTSLPTQQLILGTTMGRMMAVDLRYNSHSYRHLGVFKSYGGGAVRDIKYVPIASNKGKVISCSLDRFVRVHSFAMTADKGRTLDSRYYIKTKPTCVQPIII